MRVMSLRAGPSILMTSAPMSDEQPASVGQGEHVGRVNHSYAL